MKFPVFHYYTYLRKIFIHKFNIFFLCKIRLVIITESTLYIWWEKCYSNIGKLTLQFMIGGTAPKLEEIFIYGGSTENED